MATGVEKAADRLQGVHNLHLLVCIVVVIFGVVDVLDSERTVRWIGSEKQAVEPILRNSRLTIAALRQALYQNYGLPGGKRYLESEPARVEALVSDIYLSREYISRITNRLLDTASTGKQVFEITNHLEEVKTVFSYGLVNDGAVEGALQLANPELGSIGEPQSLYALSIQDLARLGYAASASPRTIVEHLAGVVKASGTLTGRELEALQRWVQLSKLQLESLRPLRSASSLLWSSWNKYTTELEKETALDFPVLTPETDSMRKLRASISTSQSIEELSRSLRFEDPGFRYQQLVKVPGLDIDLRLRYLLVVFPWVAGLLLAFKYVTVHQIRYYVKKASSSAQLLEMTNEVAGTLPLYRWTGAIATGLVSLFVVLSEVASIVVIPVLGWTMKAQLEHSELMWFWYGLVVTVGFWLLYVWELVRTRNALFAAP
jgi:hypothetical protein